MQLLGGIFARKNKTSRNGQDDAPTSSIYSSTPTSDTNSPDSSPTAEYVTADRSLPSSPNGKRSLHPSSAAAASITPSIDSTASASSSSSKLRLPFSRRKNSPAAPNTSTAPSNSPNAVHFSTSPRPSYMARTSTSTAASDGDIAVQDLRRLRPPPSKSAIFAAYGDPQSAFSTRSLPDEHTISPTSPSSSPLPIPPKKQSFFNWSKPPSSQAPLPPPKNTLHKPRPMVDLTPDPKSFPDDPTSSFNLKSFRHLRPPSPNTSPSPSPISLAAPIPRPRGASFASESSQRISVAAFREVQARRSQAGSPAPSFTSQNTAQLLSPPLSTGISGKVNSRPPTLHSLSTPMPPRRSSNVMSDSDDDSSEEEEDDSDEYTRRGNLGRTNTVTKRKSADGFGMRKKYDIGNGRAKSEMGHGSSSPVNSAPMREPMPPAGRFLDVNHSDVQVTSGSKTEEPSPNSGLYGRRRASVSTSALTPSAAAKRASVLSAANSPIESKRISQHIRGSSTYSTPDPSHSPSATPTANTFSFSPSPAPSPSAPPTANTSYANRYASDSESSEDDAPLASLVAPRRPGSAMSSASNPSSIRTSSAYTNPHSRSRSNLPQVPPPRKPLIDINELTNKDGKRALDAFTPPKPGEHGFTPGKTLIATSAALASGSGGPRTLSTSPVPNPPQTPIMPGSLPLPGSPPLITSKTPPGRFISPPASPAKGNRPLGVAAPASASGAGLGVSGIAGGRLAVPARKETGELSGRDMISERLSKVVQKGIGSQSSSGSGSTSGSGGEPRVAVLPPRLAAEQERLQREMEAKQRARRFSNEGGVPPSYAVGPRLRPTESDTVDDDLASMLGASIQLISRGGSEDEDESESDEEDDDYEDEEEEKMKQKEQERRAEREKEQEKETDRIAPIPIKQRAPPPSFSVTSRPQQPRTSVAGSTASGVTLSDTGSAARPRSTTLLPSSTSSSSTFGILKATGNGNANVNAHANARGPAPAKESGHANANANARSPAMGGDRPHPTKTHSSPNGGSSPGASGNGSARPRSSTLLPMLSMQPTAPATNMFPMPTKPFAKRRESPASSTGDSSSGRAPLTPRDGSELGSVADSTAGGRERGGERGGHRSSGEDREVWSGGVSGLRVGGARGAGGRHIKRRSVSFEDDADDVKGVESPGEGEIRRRERRRSEAKAAIELGNVINGRGPILDDDEEDDMLVNQNLNPRMPMNPMMGMQMGYGTPPTGAPNWGNMGGWPQPPQNPQLLSPAQFMLPQPTDPAFFAAHQQAMMIAKQAYQMAVAQQAMAAAADEWERGSSIGGFGGGGGGGGSVYGGGSSASVMGSPYGMMGGMGMQGTGGGGWSTGSMIFPAAPRSMYGGGGGGGARSDYGGGGGGGRGGGGQWSSSRSSYGESFGPSSDRAGKGGQGQGRSGHGQHRDSGYIPAVPPLPSNLNAGAATRGSPRSRTASHPASPTKSTAAGGRKVGPPSSWKAT